MKISVVPFYYIILIILYKKKKYIYVPKRISQVLNFFNSLSSIPIIDAPKLIICDQDRIGPNIAPSVGIRSKAENPQE